MLFDLLFQLLKHVPCKFTFFQFKNIHIALIQNCHIRGIGIAKNELVVYLRKFQMVAFVFIE